MLYNKGDAQPQFKGGSIALTNFLSDHLIYPEYSKRNGISGTIQVSFNIGDDGKLKNVKVYKGLGIDLDDEAVRIVKLTSGKWMASENAHVNETVILPVKFNVDITRFPNINQQNISTAIQAYKGREALISAVTNYYTNKYLGKADPTKENLITSLKAELGFDDDYIAEVLEQASAKFKQGDNDGACEDWLFIRKIGSDQANLMLSKYCH